MALVTDKKGVLGFLCDQCRRRAANLIQNQLRWRCDHNKVTIIQQKGRRVLRYDQEGNQSKTWPNFDNSGPGPYRTRALAGPSRP